MHQLSLFEGYGIELEYMIVDDTSLSVAPIADKIIHHIAGKYVAEVDRGPLAWSNELALHVIELKTNGPVKTLRGLHNIFHHDIQEINNILQMENASLLPTAMHPWMNPLSETRLWPHQYNPIYESYDRIFNCEGHGWSNLQSMHINLPFNGDDEFRRLHTAIRVILPLLPAIAASSPVTDSKPAEFLNNRMHVYRGNATRIPSIAGLIVPEFVNSIDEYHERILNPMYKDIAPFDTEQILQEEWLNSRGAIARFDRNAIEIRVIDVQECPKADIAIALLVSELLKKLTYEEVSSFDAQCKLNTDQLHAIFEETIKYGEKAQIRDANFLSVLGYHKSTQVTAQQLIAFLLQNVLNKSDVLDEHVDYYTMLFRHGTLASRIVKSLHAPVTRKQLHTLYNLLNNCLARNTPYVPDTPEI